MESSSQLIISQTETGETKLEVRLENETVWLTQKLMAELFQTTVLNINMHLKNIFEEGELNAQATIKDFLIVRLEGNREVSRNIEFYNLDRRIPMYMKDWIEKLHGFLNLNDRDILDNAGKISHKLAVEKAEIEYEKYNDIAKNAVESDFDKAIKTLATAKPKKVK